MSFVNYTDLVRLNVLDVYGGFWLDASIMLTENLDWIFKLKSEYNTDLIGFYSDLITNDFEYPILETWFIATPKNGKMIHDWHVEFRKCYYSHDPHNFYPEIKHNPIRRQNIKEDWLLDYLIAYQAAMTVMRRSKDYRIMMISASDMAHFYNFNLKLKGKDLSRLFLQGTTPEHYPKMIKFEKNGRNVMDADIAYGRYHKKSFLFSIANEPQYYFNKIKRRKRLCVLYI
ncbi:capsular polysaccharide synthesis protein [Chryseobacterium wanjuense]